MPDPVIYFQWQNKFLLQTIYPLRETKLRDFLIFYFEIEIWKKYKDKTTADIPDELQAYCDVQKGKLNEAYDTYERLLAYLLNDDITAEYTALFPEPDPEILTRITNIHKAFKTYFPNYKSPAREKYFTSERVRNCEELRKQVLFQISEKHRIIRNMGKDWPRKPDYEKAIQRLSTLSIKMVEEELNRLYAFLAAYERLEKYKLGLKNRKAEKEKAKKDAEAKLKEARSQIDPLAVKLDALKVVNNRLARPPSFPALRDYFLKPDVSSTYQDFLEPDPGVLVRIQNLHRDFLNFFPNYKNAAQEKHFIAQRIQDFDTLRAQKQGDLNERQRAMGWLEPNSPGALTYEAAIKELKAISLPMVMRELNLLYDLQWAHDHQGQPNQDFSAQIAQNQAEIAGVESKLAALRKVEADLLASMENLDALLNIPVKEQILSFMEPAFVSVDDVVRGHTEAYKQQLMQKNSDELLELVVQELVTHADRYPLWLHYMVIHFSGMRYQSAHGSWADPKEMLHALRSLDIQRDLRPLKEEAIEALCEQKYLCYQAVRAGGNVLEDDSEGAQDIPALARTQEPDWVEKVDYHLKALDPQSGYYKRRALMDTRLDEEDYDIQHYTDKQALEALEDIKSEVPDWMWREIVRVTELRLTEVTDANWEQVSPDDLAERYARGMGMFRDILYEWKRKNLTGWREEHDRTDKLIVSRAVCNEVAEHIQHLRGQNPPGGLTAKPEWYMRQEKLMQSMPVKQKAFFVKPREIKHIREGASLFWLRWVRKQPNQWQITRPLVMNNGEELVPQGVAGDYRIGSNGSAYLHTITKHEKDEFGNDTTRTDMEWLRWMHEATILEVTETVDGPTVLTFETALPTDDKRQATIGVTKYRDSDLYNRISPSLMIGTFIGYVPEGHIPYDHLREMLDWNHVLQREAFTPQQIEEYWERVPKPVEVVSFATEFVEEVPVEVVPLLEPGRWMASACYVYAADQQNMVLYQPAVTLRRGARLTINKSGMMECDGQVYYPVLQCDLDPRAQDLYLRAEEFVEAPEDSTRPFKAREDLELFRMSGIDPRGRPVFEAADAHLVAGTRLRVSTVHQAGPDTPGGGLIVGHGRQRCYLIQSCPRVPSAEGLFVAASQVRKITEKDYAISYLKLAVR